MLKFSGYPYLIRGQPFRSWGFYGMAARALRGEVLLLREGGCGETADRFEGRPVTADPQHQARGLEG